MIRNPQCCSSVFFFLFFRPDGSENGFMASLLISALCLIRCSRDFVFVSSIPVAFNTCCIHAIPGALFLFCPMLPASLCLPQAATSVFFHLLLPSHNKEEPCSVYIDPLFLFPSPKQLMCSTLFTNTRSMPLLY